MAREENVAVFEDTKRLYQTNERLKAAVEVSRKARTRQLIQKGAIMEKAMPQTNGMTLDELQQYLYDDL